MQILVDFQLSVVRGSHPGRPLQEADAVEVQEKRPLVTTREADFHVEDE